MKFVPTMRILLAFVFFLITVVNGEVITLENGALSSVRLYPSHPAAFGSNFSSNELYKANLFLAPYSDRELCEPRTNVRLDKRGLELYNKDLDLSVNIYERESWNNQTIQNHLDTFRNDVALLVRRGKCSFVTKAQNAQKLNLIYNNIFSAKRIKYLIVYNHDSRPHKKDTLLYMHSERPADDINVGLLFVSYATGSYLLAQLFTAAYKLEELGVSAPMSRYIDIGYDTDFTFPVYLNGKIPYLERTETSNAGDLNFYDALRSILISLLIVVPLCRTLFLWFKGGGRIKWRRDPETNRINGIIIVRPRSRWLCDYQRRALWNPAGEEPNTDGRESERDTQRKLTKEQVLALPEIEFKGEKEYTKEENIIHTETASTSTTSSSPSNDGINNLRCFMNKDELDFNDNTEKSSNDENKPAKASVVPSSTDKDSEQMSSNKKDTPMSVDEMSQKQQDSFKPCVACDPIEEKPCVGNQESKNDIYKISSSANVCSICIEDFEIGEKLRLLPLCGHVFHTECITPWLTERSGSCPLCKQLVLEDDKNDDDSTGGDDNSTET